MKNVVWSGPTLTIADIIAIEEGGQRTGASFLSGIDEETLIPIPVVNPNGSMLVPVPLAHAYPVTDQDGQESGFMVWRLAAPYRTITEAQFNELM